MTCAVDVVVSPEGGLGLISTPEWDSVCARQHNVLLEGPDKWAQGLLLLLEPYLRTPVVRQASTGTFERPAAGQGALVLQDVGSLNRDEQAELRAWLDDPHHQNQVVATTEYPLFPLVASGLFDESLYYRLNVMLLRADSYGTD